MRRHGWLAEDVRGGAGTTLLRMRINRHQWWQGECLQFEWDLHFRIQRVEQPRSLRGSETSEVHVSEIIAKFRLTQQIKYDRISATQSSFDDSSIFGAYLDSFHKIIILFSTVLKIHLLWILMPVGYFHVLP